MKELERLKNLVARERILRGWSQHELVAKTKEADDHKKGVGYSTITRIEQGNPPFPSERIINKIARAFGKYYHPNTIQFLDTPPDPTDSYVDREGSATELDQISLRLRELGLTKSADMVNREAASKSPAAERATKRKASRGKE